MLGVTVSNVLAWTALASFLLLSSSSLYGYFQARSSLYLLTDTCVVSSFQFGAARVKPLRVYVGRSSHGQTFFLSELFV